MIRDRHGLIIVDAETPFPASATCVECDGEIAVRTDGHNYPARGRVWVHDACCPLCALTTQEMGIY